LKTTKQPVKLSLSPQLRADAEALAYSRNESLSGMVERLLTSELNARGEIVQKEQAPYEATTPKPAKALPVDALGTAPIHQPAKAKRAG
jgi:hypothetical protein